jgi:hypothetical protein
MTNVTGALLAPSRGLSGRALVFVGDCVGRIDIRRFTEAVIERAVE